MARSLRIEFEGAFYHVTARGNEQKAIFFTKRDYEKFREYLTEAQEKYGYILHCYVFMTNHYHLLIETPSGNLKRIMHYVNSSYTNYINIKRKRCGHLFQGRYKGIVVERDSYLMELSRYIHLNPVKAKMVAAPEDYPYSSYSSYISKNGESIVNSDLILGMLSENKIKVKKKYLDFVNAGIDQDLENPLKKAYAGLILGGSTFIKEVLKKIKQTDLEMEGIIARRALQGLDNGDEIIEQICKLLRVRKNDIIQSKDKTHRDLAIYVLKKYTAMTNKEIGQILNGLSSVIVTKAHQRFSIKLKGDKKLNKKTQRILSHVRA